MRSGRKTLAVLFLVLGMLVALPFYRPRNLPPGDVTDHESTPLLLRRHVPLKLPASLRDDEPRALGDTRDVPRNSPAKVRNVEIRKTELAAPPATLAEPPSLLPRIPAPR